MRAVVERYGRRIPAAVLWFGFYAALAFVVLGANPFKAQTITPLDLLGNHRAWSWVDPTVEVRKTERSDILNALLPGWTQARDQLRHGHLPAWNDTSAGGVTQAMPNSSIYTPGFAIFAAVPDPARGFHLAIVFNLAMAGLGMHLFLRGGFLRRRLGWPAAMAGAITFAFCGFHTAWLYWPHVFTSIWAPWLLLAIDRCAQRPDMRRALGIAFASALIILGGFPFVAELLFGAGALYVLVLWAFGLRHHGSRWRLPAWYAAGTALGFLLCAIPLYELVVWMQQFDLGYRVGRGSYLGVEHASRLLPPWAYEHQRVEQTMYVGVLMVALAIAAVVGACVRWRRPAPLPVFGIALLAIAAGLVFELWPMWLIGWVPGMAFNSWSRAISILDLALIVLGACAIDHLWHRALAHRRKVLQGAVLVLVLVQAIEIAFFFRLYNGPVSAEFYYPDTPATDYLQRHAGPFDYVIADRSFQYSGALGAYGLREWFAHQFHTDAVRRALTQMVDDPFISSTASAFSKPDINTESPTLAAFNVRYLAVSSIDPQAVRPPVPEDAGHKALPSLPEHRWFQPFSVEQQPMMLEGVSVQLATHRRHDLRGRVVLSLFDQTRGQARGHNRTLLAQASVDAATIIDNDIENFYFPEPVRLAPGDYGFSIDYQPLGDSPPLTAWTFQTAATKIGLRVDGEPWPGVLDYRLHVDDGVRDRFERVFTAADISIFENTASPGGPYFIESLSQQPGRSAGADVTVAAYRPAAFTLHYRGDTPGFVVVPMKMTREWRVRIDGEPVEHRLKAGVMPAIPVSAPATITFEYRPLAWRWPWLLSWLLGLGAALAAMAFADRRLRRHVTAREDDSVP